MNEIKIVCNVPMTHTDCGHPRYRIGDNYCVFHYNGYDDYARKINYDCGNKEVTKHEAKPNLASSLHAMCDDARTLSDIEHTGDHAIFTSEIVFVDDKGNQYEYDGVCFSEGKLKISIKQQDRQIAYQSCETKAVLNGVYGYIWMEYYTLGDTSDCKMFFKECDSTRKIHLPKAEDTEGLYWEDRT